jgi:hypothetical protein
MVALLEQLASGLRRDLKALPIAVQTRRRELAGLEA